MLLKDAQKYDGYSCRVKFNVKSKKTKLGVEQDRTGVVRAVTMKLLILWPLDGEANEELHIPLKDVEKIRRL